MIGVLRHLRQLALPSGGGNLTDGQLLERFIATHDEAAFEAILRRHGPMVMGVCRRLLPCVQDAEDAFQATFLVLVHKAASVAAREAVGSWLYGIAYRTACKARVAAARRRAKERLMARPEAQPEADDLWRQLRPLIDQELGRLPEKYRAPIVLCDLEGHSRKQAAEQLGCPEGTVSGRLARARGMLAKRLARHGVLFSTAAFATALGHGSASACVPAPLAGSTIKAAALVAAGQLPAGVVSAPVAALTAGVLKSMGISKLKLVLAALLAIGLFGIGLGVCSSVADDNSPNAQPPAQAGGGAGAGLGGGGGGKVPAEAKIDLPMGPPPIQVLASIDKDGKLVIKRAIMQFAGFPGGGAGGPGRPGAGFIPAGGGAGLPALPGGPGAPGGAGGPPGAGGFPGGGLPAPIGAGGMRLDTQTYDLDKVEVLDTKAKKLDPKEVTRLLKKETVALATWSSPIDPLHLRVIKDGTLTFVLPNVGFRGGPPGGPGGGGIPGLPGAAPPLPPPPGAVPVGPGQP